MNQNPESTLIQHLVELRRRLIYSMLAWLGGIGICLYFSKEIFGYLSLPLKRVLPEGSHFIATHPVEAWTTYFKASLLAGFFLSSPFLFYQLWKFVAPGLLAKEKKVTLGFVISSSIFFIGGSLFGYHYIFPITFQYFSGLFSGTDILLLPRMADYFSLAAQMLLAFGLIFELPLLIYFLASSGIVSFKTLWGFQRYLIVVAFIVGAILTPPDVLSQTLLSIPIILLYQVGLLGAWFHRKKKPKES